MWYLGSKLRLIDFLSKTISDFIKNDNCTVFGDAFAGTGQVGRFFKQEGYQVFANDIQYYSFVLNRHYIENSEDILFDYSLQLKDENINYDYYIKNNYTGKRNYFSPNNAELIDIIRTNIQNCYLTGHMNIDSYYYHLACLLEAVDKVANTASVYSAFLKKLKKSALQSFKFVPITTIYSEKKCKAFHLDALDFVKNNEFDILYLDPPYNHRQYSSNYHILDTICKWDFPQLKGKTGMRTDLYSSPWCSKVKAFDAFVELIDSIKSKYIFLSYNNEGILPMNFIQDVLQKKGKYELKSTYYNRYKADNKRIYKADKTVEYLHCVKCN